MTNLRAKLPIGIFDSGIGGISVLAAIIKMLPYEEFIYYADTLNSPYGTKQENIVLDLSMKAAKFLSLQGIKAMVVACNTATSAGINEIRRLCAFPVIGMEPAVKLAVELGSKGKILVMATPLTLKSRKFNELNCRYKHLADICSLPCEGLVEIIEQGNTGGQEIEGYLSRLLSSIQKEEVSIIVLGCTHYVLIKKEIEKIAGNGIRVVDGNYGTAKRLKTILQNEHLLTSASVIAENVPAPIKASVRFYISGNERDGMITRCRQLLRSEGIVCKSEFLPCG